MYFDGCSVRVLPGQNIVKVVAKSEAIAQAVRAQLEYVEESIAFPQKLVGWIVGKQGATIRDIQQKSECFRILVGMVVIRF